MLIITSSGWSGLVAVVFRVLGAFVGVGGEGREGDVGSSVFAVTGEGVDPPGGAGPLSRRERGALVGARIDSR